MSSIYDVAQFQEKFGFPPNRAPGFLADDQMKERLDFMLEELLETAHACGYELDTHMHCTEDSVKFVRKPYRETDLEKAFDGLLDLVYVTLGTAVLMGFHNLIPAGAKSRFATATIWWEGWRRVHAANMAKRRVTDVSQSKRGTLNDTYKPHGWLPPRFDDLLKS